MKQFLASLILMLFVVGALFASARVDVPPALTPQASVVITKSEPGMDKAGSEAARAPSCRAKTDVEPETRAEREIPEYPLSARGKGPIFQEPVEVVHLYNPFQGSCAYAGKLAFDGAQWRRQIVYYNATPKPSYATQPELWRYVWSLRKPHLPGGMWESSEYKLFPCKGVTYGTNHD